MHSFLQLCNTPFHTSSIECDKSPSSCFLCKNTDFKPVNISKLKWGSNVIVAMVAMKIALNHTLAKILQSKSSPICKKT